MIHYGRYKIKIDSELALTILPYAYSEFWADEINWESPYWVQFKPINHLCTMKEENWPKYINVPISRCIVYDMKGES